MKRHPRRKEWMAGYLMLMPFLLLFTLFIIVPVIYGIIMSFTNYNIIEPMRFAGFSNYIELFTNDELFLTAIGNTLTFAFIAGPIGFFCSFFFAWVINQLHFKTAFSLAFYAPSITSGVAISVVWLYLFSSDRYGLVNSVLLRMGLVSSPMLWTKDPTLIMPVIIIISLWMSMGSGFLTNLAGLAGINMEIYEAGRIDGISNRFQELWYLTMPLMKPYLLFNAIMSVVNSLNMNDVAVTVAGFPSPDYAAHTIVAHMNDYGFTRFELGYASAIAFVLFLLNFGLGKIFMRVLGSKEE